jgi:hypothetical protein
MMKTFTKFLLLSSLIFNLLTLQAQPDRWQQRIKYNINVKMDVQTNRFSGTEKIEYINNSPDTLDRIFFHVYWNAFQPNSGMDMRSRELGKTILTNRRGDKVQDWDARVKDRISKLKEDEIGFQNVKSVKINGIEQKLRNYETIVEVKLDKAILSKSKTIIDVTFEAQVPLQIRRSGRDNAEGVRYSMAQWYPKVVEYDYQGWNANPYIAREFYGVWGDYDVNITIDKNYFVTAGGDLINANEIGLGYETAPVKPNPVAGKTTTWKWQAYNVHDFVWAADTSYKMITRNVKDGPLIRVVYKRTDSITDAKWQRSADTAALAYPFIAKTFGAYPYKTYTFIQGGDGGMEYPMATLVKNWSIGTFIHEWMHSWYQGMFGTNESLYAWMDEGFTNYAGMRVVCNYKNIPSTIYDNEYKSYFNLARSGMEEPLSTHADHFNTNYGYSTAAYSKGAVFLNQLGYIVGDKVLDKILLEYYRQWRFKHPNANDFVRVAEKVSGIELQWYKEYWVYSTKTIDYAVGDINVVNGKTQITLKRIGKMPMPIDVLVTYKDGTKELHYIPLNLMYGEKPIEDSVARTVHSEWKWTHPEYNFETSRSIKEIKSIEIDPSQRMADLNRTNNKLVIPD